MNLLSRNRPLRKLLSAALGFAMLIAGLTAPQPARATAGATADLIISEYIEGSSNNKALELYNPTDQPIDLAAGGYRIEMYFNGSASAGLSIDLSGVVPPGATFVLAHSSAAQEIRDRADQLNGAGWFNGDDAVVLRRGDGSVVDSIGQVGFDPGTAWGSGDVQTVDRTLRRKASVLVGDTDPTDPFDPALEWDGYPRDTFDGLGSHEVTGPSPGNAPILATCPALRTFEGVAGTVTIAATDPDGRVTAIDLEEAPVASVSLTDVTPASEVGGTATAILTAGPDLSAGTYAVRLRFANDDAEPQTASCTIAVTVDDFKFIGEVQGPVGPDDDGRESASPYAGQEVVVRGIVTQKLLTRTSSGSANHGLFIQEAADASDGDPYTSDGLYVFLGRYTTLRHADGGFYEPQVGDELILRGRVEEYFGLTELTGATVLAVLRTGLNVREEVEVVVADPPDDEAEAARYWERLEGMQVEVPAGAIALGPRLVFSSTADAEVGVLNPGHPVARRPNPYERRAFRDAHPLDNEPDLLFDDGNGYRIILGSLGIKAAEGDSLAMIASPRTFDTLSAPVTGGVYYAFSKYTVQVAEQPEWTTGPDPTRNAPPGRPDREREFTVATYNVENLYDYRNDPFDGCDFHGDPGCPGVSPDADGRYNYVPDSEGAYRHKLERMARQIVEDLHAPDLLLIQEAEDQDICRVDSGALVCGGENDADGKPDTLQELALAIAALGGPSYDAAYDRSGADDRGIVSAFLFRTDRVEVLTPSPDHPVLGSNPAIPYPTAGLPYNREVQNPKALNAVLPQHARDGADGVNVFTRAPQVGLFRIWRSGVGQGTYTDLYAIANHFSSGPDRRVAQRREQAAYNAAIVAALAAVDPDVQVVVGGDLNTFPRPDEPIPSQPGDQLGPLYDQGLHNLYDILVAEEPASAYSYVYDHQAQTLDHLFVTKSLLDRLVEVRAAHINADWPEGYPGGGARGVSDHDPQVARFALPASLDGLEALIRQYDQAGAFKGKQVAKILLDRIAKAREFLADGKRQPAESMIRAFINQVDGFEPQQIDPDAAEVLIREAQVLLETGL